MKTIAASRTAALESTVLAVIPLVRLTTYADRDAQTGPTVFHFSDRYVRYPLDGGPVVQFEPFLIDFDVDRTTMNHVPEIQSFSDGSIVKRMRIALRNHTRETGNSLYKDLRAENLEFSAIEVAQLIVNRDAGEGFSDLTALSGTEHTYRFRGDLEEVAAVTEDELLLSFRSRNVNVPWIIVGEQGSNQADLRDIGRRVPVVYGSMPKVPAVGYDIGWTTTLGEAIDASQPTIQVTDASRFRSSTLRIGLEEVIFTGTSGDQLTGVTRGANGTTAAAHAAGAVVLEIGTFNTWVVAGHEVDAINSLYAVNFFTGGKDLIRVDDVTAFTKTLANTTLIPGKTVATISFDLTQYRALIAAMISQAQVDTQPEFSHSISTGFDQVPVSSGPTDMSAAYDGNLATFFDLGAVINRQVNFTDPVAGGGTFLLQMVWAYISQGGGPITDTFRLLSIPGNLGTAFLTVSPGSPAGWYRGSTTNIVHSIGVEGDVDLHEVYRQVVIDGPPPTRTTNVAVSGGGAGFGFQFFADVDGVPAPDGNYIASTGTLLTKAPDILRHLIAELCGLGHAAIDTAWDDAADATHLDDNAHACVINMLGTDFDTIASRIAFETRANLTSEERQAGTVYRLLVAESDYDWGPTPANSRDIVEWSQIAERGRTTRELFSRFRFLYGLDASRGDGPEAFDSLVQIDLDQNDASAKLATAELIAAEARYGRRDAPAILLATVRDQATAIEIGAYYAHESIRVAATWEFNGVPWRDAFDLERGDLVQFITPWDGTGHFGRIVEYEKSPETEMIDLIVVEIA